MPSTNPETPMTQHQINILQAIADGVTGEELGDELWTTRQGVYAAMERVKKKLKARNTNEAVAIGFRKGILK